MNKLVNLTPHAIRIMQKDSIFTIPPSGYEARVEVTIKQLPPILQGEAKICVVKRNYGPVEIPLREWKDGEHFIVSSLVLEALREKKVMAWFKRSFYAPDTGPTAVRDKKTKRIIAVRRLITL